MNQPIILSADDDDNRSELHDALDDDLVRRSPAGTQSSERVNCSGRW
jgi:hypothetical protein